MRKAYLYTLTLTAAIFLRSITAMANNTALFSGAWETGTNWSTGVAPVATDDVVIPPGITMTVSAVGDVCGTLTINALGTVAISAGESLSIGGNFTNAGTFTAAAGSTLTFNGAANSVISGGGSYSIAATVVMNMGSSAITLDVQDANFNSGINTGAKYYFTFTQGTWIQDNTGTMNDSYNSGSSTALTIPYGVTLQVNSGTFNLARKATSGKMLLSGKLFVNGGTVDVQTGQTLNSGYDFRYAVNGGTPQLYVASGTMYIGAGFNPNTPATDYIDFHMTGGTIIVAEDGYSKSETFFLANNVGGRTFMSAGLIILQDACDAAAADLDMGGANVAATEYSVTGGTVQIGYAATQASSTFFGINAEPATNYPNIDFQSGTAKTVQAWNGGKINMLSLYINPAMTFNASNYSTVNITSTNGTFAFDDEGTFTTGTNTVSFTGSINQPISSSALANLNFYNLTIANTGGNVTLGVNTTVNKQLTLTSGLLDASKKTLTLSNGSVLATGQSQTSYVIVGNGFNTFGNMIIDNLPSGTNVPFPIGTASYYLPAIINAASAGTTYTAYVFTGATTNAKANGPSFSASLLANMLNAIWNISQTAGSGSATINLDWTPAETALEGSTFATSGTSIGIIQYNSASGWTTPTGTGNVATAVSSSTFSSFTQFAVTDYLFVLPVVIYDFNAVPDNNKVLVSWSASDDVAINNFEVERSADGVNFSPIGTIDAISAQSSYSFTDPSPLTGPNYYRLRIQCTDGTTMYSGIKVVDLSVAGSITVYPIPATTRLNISLGNAGTGVSVRLISQTGQIMQSATATGGSQVISMDISSYPAGVYFVQVIGQNRILQTTTVSRL